MKYSDDMKTDLAAASVCLVDILRKTTIGTNTDISIPADMVESICTMLSFFIVICTDNNVINEEKVRQKLDETTILFDAIRIKGKNVFH